MRINYHVVLSAKSISLLGGFNFIKKTNKKTERQNYRNEKSHNQMLKVTLLCNK